MKEENWNHSETLATLRSLEYRVTHNGTIIEPEIRYLNSKGEWVR